MKTKMNFLRVYLYLAISFGIMGILDEILIYFNLTFHSSIFSLLLIAFFFFNIISIAFFHHHRIQRIAYVLPIYYLISYLTFNIFALILLKYNLFVNWNILLTIIAFLSSIFEIGFSSYLLDKFELLPFSFSSASKESSK